MNLKSTALGLIFMISFVPAVAHGKERPLPPATRDGKHAKSSDAVPNADKGKDGKDEDKEPAADAPATPPKPAESGDKGKDAPAAANAAKPKADGKADVAAIAEKLSAKRKLEAIAAAAAEKAKGKEAAPEETDAQLVALKGGPGKEDGWVTLSKDQVPFREFGGGVIPGTRTARLTGRVFEACLRHFRFEVASLNDKGQTGWLIYEHGEEGRKCMRAKQGDVCSETEGSPNRCHSLSQFAPQITVSENVRAQVGVVQIDMNKDEADAKRISVQDFSPSIRLKSSADVARQEALDTEKERQRLVKRFQNQIRTCRKNADELEVARRALQGLYYEGEIEEGALNRLNAELDRQFLRMLQAKAQNPRTSIDELGDLREQVVSFAEQHSEDNPKYSLAASHIMRTIAARYVRQKEVTEDSFSDARSTLTQASELSGLDEANQARMDGYQNDLDVAETAFNCRTGDPFTCTPSYNSLMQTLNQRTWDACTGWNMDPTSCLTARNTAQSAPAQISEVIQQRRQLMQSIWQNPAAANPNLFGGATGVQQNAFMTGSLTNPLAALGGSASGLPSVPPMAGLR